LMVSFKSTTTDQDNPNKSPWPSWGRKGGRWSNPLPPQNARQFMHHKRGTFERIFCQNSFDAICQSILDMFSLNPFVHRKGVRSPITNAVSTIVLDIILYSQRSNSFIYCTANLS
jgi:hypothetical protein